MTPLRRPLLAAMVVLALLAAACGGGDDSGSGDGEGTSTTSGQQEGSDATTTSGDGSATAAGAVIDLDGVESAVVQILAKGNFAQPAGSLTVFEEVNTAGSGSGFIIDPEGIAVTNNHVVTGAATLEVFVGGADEPVNAKVLGVSECSDLAVIDLDGDGYPYLNWYEGEIDTGLEIRAAGFPLGDPEYTLTSGIISKASAAGDTNWASVDAVIEHDANIQPGNSGGPLVDVETGQVVAVNYAGGDPGTGTAQFFAISSDLARDLVEELREGDVLSLGVNGQAFVDEETGIQGIWTASVDTDSPAGALGLQGGDIIERIEGLAVGTDGTMADYCNILRSHDPDDKLSVQVLRFEENARLEGEFSGEELAVAESLASAVEEQTGARAEAGEAVTETIQVSNDTGELTVHVPATWTDVSGAPQVLDDGTELPSVMAAPDLAAYSEQWNASGVEFAAVGPEFSGDVGALLDAISSSASQACEDAGREDYEDPAYTGLIHFFSGCGGTDAVVVSIAAQPPDARFTALLLVQMATEADIAALDTIVQTFTVNL